jgi:hypothetical protein
MACVYKHCQKSKRNKTEGKTVQQKSVNSQIMLMRKISRLLRRIKFHFRQSSLFYNNTTDNAKPG